MSNHSQASSDGVWVLGLLGVVFITLKLCGVIDWSWWYVTSTFWGPLAFALVLASLVCVIAVLIAVADRLTGK